MIQLHCHSEYSLLDSPVPPKSYAAKAAEIGATHVALTDHGSLSGTMKFLNECRLAGVQPILGCEFYLNNKPEETGDSYREHMVALARNKAGWLELLSLNKYAHQKGFYYRPRISMDLLLQNCRNLVVSSACIQSPFFKLCQEKNVLAARLLANQLLEATGGNFYFEFIFNHLPQQIIYNDFLREVINGTSYRYIITNDIHYMTRGDAILREIMRMIFYKQSITQLNVAEIGEEMWFKNPEDIWETVEKFGFKMSRRMFDEGVERTIEVASLIEPFEIKLGRYAIPNFCETKVEADAKIKHLCWKRFADILGPGCSTNHEWYGERLDRELKVIAEKDFSNYFLIIWDIVNFCKHEGIFIGVGRGSAVGSLVAYFLGITRIDPIVHGLMFERFLSRARKEPPDIDMDFEAEKRDVVEQYICDRYGDKNVGHVFTFGSFGTRGVIRDIGRVFELDSNCIESLAKSAKDDSNVVEEAERFIREHPYEQAAIAFMKENATIWNLAERIRGRLRHYSLHASGVIIDTGGLVEIPVLRVKDKLVCAYQEGSDEREISELGLIKFDILGLTACTIIKNTVEMVRAKEGKDIATKLDSFDFIKHKYVDIFKMFNDGNTAGVFQFSSPGIKQFMGRVGVDKFDDLVAINALYRPANLESGEAEEYRRRKIDGVGFAYLDPRLRTILEGTFGCVVFQEQVLQILHAICGLSLEEADEARSLFKKFYALGKTAEANNVTMAKMAMFKENMIERMEEAGLTKDKADALYALILNYTKYAFNKSHATAYAYVAFQMMWLKYYYPAEFFTAAMNAEIGDEIKVAAFRAEARRCKHADIKIYSPRINKSVALFEIEYVNAERKLYGIRTGFISINGIGDRAAEEIVKVQPVVDFADFQSRVNKRVVNKRVVEILRKNYVFEGLVGAPTEAIE